MLFLYALKKRTCEEPVHNFLRTLFYFPSWFFTDDLPQWQESKFCTFVEALHRSFLVSHSFIWSKERVKSGISGCHFRVEITFLGHISGWTAQEALVSTVYGCSSISAPQVLN